MRLSVPQRGQARTAKKPGSTCDLKLSESPRTITSPGSKCAAESSNTWRRLSGPGNSSSRRVASDTRASVSWRSDGCGFFVSKRLRPILGLLTKPLATRCLLQETIGRLGVKFDAWSSIVNNSTNAAGIEVRFVLVPPRRPPRRLPVPKRQRRFQFGTGGPLRPSTARVRFLLPLFSPGVESASIPGSSGRSTWREREWVPPPPLFKAQPLPLRLSSAYRYRPSHDRASAAAQPPTFRHGFSGVALGEGR